MENKSTDPTSIRNRYSIWAIAALIVTALLFDGVLGHWKQSEGVITHDARSYYGYLPAYFIFKDLKTEKSDYQYDEGKYWLWTVTTEKGKEVFKMNCGVALMESPFFLMAHQLAKKLGYPPTGFSLPYRVFILVGALFWFTLGLFLLRDLLLRLGFADMSTALTLLIIGAGTNLLFYATADALMSHVHSFFLVAAAVTLLLRFQQSPGLKTGLLFGLVFGLITLLRLSNAVFIVFVVLLVWPRKGNPRLANPLMLAAFMLLGIGVAWLPQLAYWKAVAGEYLVYSYGEEGFFFSDPMLKEGLIGFRRGWLVYTPLMILALIGLCVNDSRITALKPAIVALLIIHFYVVVSWWCWWYGGSYGQRAMIDIYPILAFPIALCVDRILHLRRSVVMGLGLLIVFLIGLNLFQMLQYVHGGLHHDAMTARGYLRQFGQLQKQAGIDSVLVYPDYDAALHGDR
ncbi:MAG: hypothetical protein ACK5CT_04905 [Bacteroidota bacterium]